MVPVTDLATRLYRDPRWVGDPVDVVGDEPLAVECLLRSYHHLFCLGIQFQDMERLRMGNAQAAAPQYDLRLVANQLLMADKHLATPGPEEELKKASWAERQKAGQGGWLLWCVLTVVVVALLVVIARLMPKQQPPPA